MDRLGASFDDYLEERLKNPEFRGYFEEAGERSENELRLVKFAEGRLRELGDGEDDLSERVTVNPEVMVGKPIIRDMRITVEQIIEALAGGVSEADLLEDYPMLEPEDFRAVLVHVTRNGLWY